MSEIGKHSFVKKPGLLSCPVTTLRISYFLTKTVLLYLIMLHQLHRLRNLDFHIDKLISIWKKAMKDEFNEISQHLSRLTEENHTTPQSK